MTKCHLSITVLRWQETEHAVDIVQMIVGMLAHLLSGWICNILVLNT